MRRRPLSPSQLFTLSFVGAISLGTILLWLPTSAAPGQRLSAIDALFTATSAVCVTGLIVVDTPRVLSTAGEIVLMVLIQLGGLGYMTFSTIIVTALGRRVTLQERLTLQEALSAGTLEGVAQFATTVLKVTLALEFAGAALLTMRWWSEFGLVRAAYLGLFHAVSAFNNAGFSLFSGNLVRYRGDLIVTLVVTSLVICGGLGFLVLAEVGRLRRRIALSVHAKFVLAITAMLILCGSAAIFLLERSNPRTLAPLPVGEAALAAYFQAVVPRTAGFNTLDIGALQTPTLFLMMVLMFIGASPGGTGGGIKTTTFGAAVLALWATIRGQAEPVIFHRRISAELIARAFGVALIAFLVLNMIASLLLIVERGELLPTLFETTSAFGTVGLSVGRPGSVVSLVGHFSSTGKLLIAAMMFMGRVGPLTLAVALAGRRAPPRLHYPEGKVLIG